MCCLLYYCLFRSGQIGRRNAPEKLVVSEDLSSPASGNNAKKSAIILRRAPACRQTLPKNRFLDIHVGTACTPVLFLSHVCPAAEISLFSLFFSLYGTKGQKKQEKECSPKMVSTDKRCSNYMKNPSFLSSCPVMRGLLPSLRKRRALRKQSPSFS